MRRVKGYAIFLSLLLLASSCYAQERGAFVSSGIGAKTMGMGGASVSIASDCSALYWNVAGLAESKTGNLIFGNQALYGLGVGYNQIAASQALGKIGVMGISYERTDFSQAVAFGYFEEQIGVGVATELQLNNQNIKTGIGLNLYRSNLDSPTAKAKTFGVGLNLGLQLPLGEKMKVGVSLRDLINGLSSERDFEGEAEHKLEKLPLQISLGASYQLNPNSVIALDLVDLSQFNLGGEYQLSDYLALRGGLCDGNLTAGIGVQFNKLKLDYSYSPTMLGDNQRITLGFDF